MNWRWKLAQAAEIRWWRRYLKRQTPTEYLHRKQLYWNRVLNRLELKVPVGAKVLDAGCGPAGIFIVLPKQKVCAVDPLLDQYAKKLVHFSPTDYPWVKFQKSKLEDFTSETLYDYLFCMNAINHVDDLDRSIDRLIAAGRPGGCLILSVDAHNFRFFRYLFSWLPGDILHPHQYFLQEYKNKLTQRGCRIKRACLLKKNYLFNYYALAVQLPE